jgi:hypothetical protein
MCACGHSHATRPQGRRAHQLSPAAGHFTNDVATGLPALQVTTITAEASVWSLPAPLIRPVQLVCVDDVALQLPAKVRWNVPLLFARLNRKFNALPVNVPVMLVLMPSEGNEPEYRVGISPTAIAAVAMRITPAANAATRICLSPYKSISRNRQ